MTRSRRCATASASAPTSTCPPAPGRCRPWRSASRTGSAPRTWRWTWSAASSPARATPASCRTCAASSRPRGRSIPALPRSRTATTRSSGSRRSEWCDGRVGLWGESYYGYTSLAAAISGHPAIACIAPGDIGVDRRAAWFRQGAFLQNTTGYWAMAMDDQEYADVTTVDPWHLPLARMAATAGLDGAYFREILDRVEDDEWWGRRGLLGRLSGVRVPILSWGGWYDNYLGPQLARPHHDPRCPPRSSRGAPDDRAVGPRGQRRLHRPRGVHPAAADVAAPLGRLPGVLRPLPDGHRQRLRQRGAGRAVHAGPEHVAPRAGVAAAGLRTDADVPAGGRVPQRRCLGRR